MLVFAKFVAVLHNDQGTDYLSLIMTNTDHNYRTLNHCREWVSHWTVSSLTCLKQIRAEIIQENIFVPNHCKITDEWR